MSAMKGFFCWFDYNAKDPEGAKAFYTETIGWTTEHMEEMDYTMWKAESGTIGGLMKLAEEAEKMGAPSHWLGYVWVDDVDACVGRATEAGATIYVPATDIPNIGRFAIFADPMGGVIAAYTSTSGDDAAPGEPGQGEVSWAELMTGDLDAGWSFYEKTFGWNKTEAMDMGPEVGTYQMFGNGERSVGGMMKAPEGVPPHWLYYVHVADIHGTIERAKSNGATLLNGPMEIPGGDLVAQLMDNQGGAFALHGPNK